MNTGADGSGPPERAAELASTQPGSGAGAHILVVEDQPDIARALSGFLRQSGYRVSAALDGLSALEHFHRQHPDLVLLDWMLPGLSGPELLRQFRAVRAVPVVFVTARATEAEVLEGFRAGADDYVTKPFRMRELLARVAAVLRRAAPEGAVLEGEAGLRLDPVRREVWLAGQVLDLTVSEFEVLCTLLRARGRPFTRLELLGHLPGERDTLERTVDTHVKNLRRKLGEHPALETVYGLGYRYGD